MSPLPPVSPPPDFENAVLVRSLLSALPTVPPPDAFESQVLLSVKRPKWTLKIISAVVGIVAIVSTVYLLNSNSDVVVVRPQTVVDAPVVDLYNLSPVPVTQDTRHKDLPPEVIHKLAAKLKAVPVVRRPHGVAGY
ncbi:MAG: hypothetical protein KBB72_00865 [Candidatus Kapabacteria bacterium]|nr:hypothetical protein [Candidatus Kapabacteria bacterium]